MSRNERYLLKQDNNSFAISFLDVLSCGFGGAILLFLSFSVIKTPVTVPVNIGKTINLQVIINNQDLVYGLFLIPPEKDKKASQNKMLAFYSDDFLAGGQLKNRIKDSLPQNVFQDLFVTGLTPPDIVISNNDSSQISKNLKKTSLIVMINEPQKGQWYLALRPIDKAKPDVDLNIEHFVSGVISSGENINKCLRIVKLDVFQCEQRKNCESKNITNPSCNEQNNDWKKSGKIKFGGSLIEFSVKVD